MSLKQQISELTESTELSQHDKIEQYTNFLGSLDLQNPAEWRDNLQQLCTYLTELPASSMMFRTWLAKFVDYISSAATQTPERLEVCAAAAEKLLQAPNIHSMLATFEVQNTQLRELIARAYESHSQHIQAASVLRDIPFDSVSNIDHKLTLYLHIAQLYLENAETEPEAEAEPHISSAAQFTARASALVHRTDKPELRLKYKIAQARISHYTQKYLEAAMLYYELSYHPDLADNDRLNCLGKAISCSVLAQTGTMKNRVLAALLKDDRCAAVFPEQLELIAKLYTHGIIRPAETARLAETLPPADRRAHTSDGTSVLEYAIIEHNILSCSLMLDNVRLASLARILGVPPERAESYAARMVFEGRLAARIDQETQVLQFDSRAGAPGAHNMDKLLEWHAQIDRWCLAVDQVSARVK